MPNAAFLHARVIPETTIAADSVRVDVLQNLPLSFIAISIRPLNNTATLSNFARQLAIAASLTNIQVVRDGTSIVNISGSDLMLLNSFRRGIASLEANGNDTDNDRRAVQLIVPFGKYLADPSECLPPPTRPGGTAIQLTIDVANTGYDGFAIEMEAFYLPNAKPARYERNITQAEVLVAGVSDIQLYSPEWVRGIGIFSPTGWTGGTPAPTVAAVKLLIDGQEWGYQDTEWAQFRGMGNQLFGRQPFFDAGHSHRLDGSSVSTTLQTFSVQNLDQDLRNFGFLEFDFDRSDNFTLDLGPSRSSVLRTTCATAGTARIIPVEVYKV